MAHVMKISPQGQIRIPKKIMQIFGIEAGDYVEIAAEDDQITLKPRKLIDPAQGWYWTKEWQRKEQAVDEDIKRDDLSQKFKTAEEGLQWLKE